MLLRRYIDMLRMHWFAIVACALLGVVASGAVALRTPPTYTATATLYVSAQNGNDAMSAYQGGMFTQQRVKSYTELIQSERVASEVASRLNLPDAPADLAREISATSSQDTVVINVAVTDTSPERACMIANAIGTAFPALVARLEQPDDVHAVPAAKASVVTEASIPTRPSSSGAPMRIALGLVAGLLVGLVYAKGRDSLRAALSMSPQPQPAATDTSEAPSPPPVVGNAVPHWPTSDTNVAPPLRPTQPFRQGVGEQAPPTPPKTRPVTGHRDLNGQRPTPFPRSSHQVGDLRVASSPPEPPRVGYVAPPTERLAPVVATSPSGPVPTAAADREVDGVSQAPGTAEVVESPADRGDATTAAVADADDQTSETAAMTAAVPHADTNDEPGKGDARPAEDSVEPSVGDDPAPNEEQSLGRTAVRMVGFLKRA